MSNLSDLLPSGGGQNIVDFTASGTVASGKPVVLNANGTVSQVAQTAAGVGSEYVFEAATAAYTDVSYDSVNNKIVAAYADNGDSQKGKAVVGTVTGTTISWGTPVVFADAVTLDVCIACGGGKAIICYSDSGNSNYATAIAGVVSGDTISFGTETVINSGGQLYTPDLLYFSPSDNPTYAHRWIVGYSRNGGRGIVNLIGISGTNTIAASGEYEPAGNNNASFFGIAYAADQSGKNIIITFKDSSDSNKVKYVRAQWSAGTLPGNLSLGSSNFAATNSTNTSVAWDTSASKVLLAYKSVASSNELRYAVGTFSGTEDITWETAVNSTATMCNLSPRLAYDSAANKTVIMYGQDNDSGNGKVAHISISGTTATIGTIYTFNSGTTVYPNLAYNSTAENVVLVYQDQGNSSYGTSIIYRDVSTNLTATNFLGLADAAISDTATGKINVKGSINSKQSSLTIGSDYYVQSDGSVSTTSTSPAVKIGQAVTATTINMMDLT